MKKLEFSLASGKMAGIDRGLREQSAPPPAGWLALAPRERPSIFQEPQAKVHPYTVISLSLSRAPIGREK